MKFLGKEKKQNAKRPMTIRDVHSMNRLSGLGSYNGNSVYSSQSYDWDT